ncbi:hypothetical protein [Cupriavidus sp.]
MSQQDDINELLHKMTVAETRDVRLALCAQIKRELAQLLDSAATAGGKQ